MRVGAIQSDIVWEDPEANFQRLDTLLDELKAASLDPEEPDPLARMMDTCTMCLRDTASDPSRKRVFDILFLKCEFVEEMGPVMARNQNTSPDSSKIEIGRDGKLQLDLFDPDLSRVEYMEFKPSSKSCCSKTRINWRAV